MLDNDPHNGHNDLTRMGFFRNLQMVVLAVIGSNKKAENKVIPLKLKKSNSKVIKSDICGNIMFIGPDGEIKEDTLDFGLPAVN